MAHNIQLIVRILLSLAIIFVSFEETFMHNQIEEEGELRGKMVRHSGK